MSVNRQIALGLHELQRGQTPLRFDNIIPFLVTTRVRPLNGFKEYCIFYAISCRNGITGFGPVPRYTIKVERKGQIRDWPK